MGESLRDLIARRRRELGLTQTEVSERSGMSQEWASKVERGEIKNPRKDALLRLADALDIPHDEIIVVAGFAPSHKAARVMLSDLSIDEQDALANLHERIDPDLRKILHNPKQVDYVVAEVKHAVRALQSLTPPADTAPETDKSPTRSAPPQPSLPDR